MIHAVSGTPTAVSSLSLTDTGQTLKAHAYQNRWLTDSAGHDYQIKDNSTTTFALDVAGGGAPTTPSDGAYTVNGGITIESSRSGGGLYVGTPPSIAGQTGGICASEIGASCPTSYVRGDHGFFGTGDGGDQDLTVIGCSNQEQIRWVSPYRPSTCHECGTGTNGCGTGTDCAWNTVTQVNDYGHAADFAPMVRTSDLHIDPGVDQEWTGINDGNDTGRILLVTNDSDMNGSAPHTMTFRNDSTSSSSPGNRFLFPDGLDNWIMPPGGKAFFMHDDSVGPNRFRLVGWGSTHYPSLSTQQLKAEATMIATVSSCGASPSISSGDWAATVTGGGGSPTTCTVTFAKAFSTTPTCVVSNQGVYEGYWHSYTVTSTTLTMSSATSGYPITKFDYICVGH